MTRRILLFGATGYTGGLTAEALVRAGHRPVLVGRDAMATAEVARRMCPQQPLEHLTADVTDIDGLYQLVTADDVVVTTVGPFLDLGSGLARVCAESGASYLDSTGESPFIRWVFDGLSPAAEANGARLMPAFGYDYVPGQLAGATALRGLADPALAHRLEVGYFVTGLGRGRGRGQAFSGGTLASMTRMSGRPTYTYRQGLVAERLGARTATFEVHGRRLTGLSLGATEQLTMPQLAPELAQVDVYLGWFGPATRLISATSGVRDLLGRLPGLATAGRALTGRIAGAASREPSPEAVQQSRTLAVARVLDCSGSTVGETVLEGPSPYPLTAELLAWAAGVEAERPVEADPPVQDGPHGRGGPAGPDGTDRTGALGPVQAYGLAGLSAACAELGLVPAPDSVTDQPGD